MKQFLITVGAGLTVGLVLNSLKKSATAPMGTKEVDYTGQAFAEWTEQQRGG